MALLNFYTEKFVQDIEGMGKAEREAVLKKIGQIAQNPTHFEFLVKGDGLQKARVGKIRIVFRVDKENIRFYRAGKRDEIYRGMQKDGWFGTP